MEDKVVKIVSKWTVSTEKVSKAFGSSLIESLFLHPTKKRVNKENRINRTLVIFIVQRK
jgi:hypothetical protein